MDRFEVKYDVLLFLISLLFPFPFCFIQRRLLPWNMLVGKRHDISDRRSITYRNNIFTLSIWISLQKNKIQGKANEPSPT